VSPKRCYKAYKKICTFATISEENLQITAFFVPEYMPAPA
jgi:hypothetical protein